MKAIFSFLSICLFSVTVSASSYRNTIRFSLKETPAKTICIKHPDANKASFFSTVTILHFEVYKPDTKADIVTIVDKLSKDPHVQSCNVGKQTGDYYAIHLILNKAADKAWFISTFKSLGLNTIKLNNAEVTDVEKI